MFQVRKLVHKRVLVFVGVCVLCLDFVTVGVTVCEGVLVYVGDCVRV